MASSVAKPQIPLSSALPGIGGGGGLGPLSANPGVGLNLAQTGTGFGSLMSSGFGGLGHSLGASAFNPPTARIPGQNVQDRFRTGLSQFVAL